VLEDGRGWKAIGEECMIQRSLEDGEVWGLLEEEDAVVGADQELGADKKDVGGPCAITESFNDN